MGHIAEQFIINQEKDNGDFSFLVFQGSNENIYYRWRCYSFIQGDTEYQWRQEPFYMSDSKVLWIPPKIVIADKGNFNFK